jgi:hypothetical protein
VSEQARSGEKTDGGELYLAILPFSPQVELGDGGEVDDIVGHSSRGETASNIDEMEVLPSDKLIVVSQSVLQ